MLPKNIKYLIDRDVFIYAYLFAMIAVFFFSNQNSEINVASLLSILLIYRFRFSKNIAYYRFIASDSKLCKQIVATETLF